MRFNTRSRWNTRRLRCDWTDYAPQWVSFPWRAEDVMRWTLGYVRGGYGSVDGYLDRIGFDADARRGLARALCE